MFYHTILVVKFQIIRMKGGGIIENTCDVACVVRYCLYGILKNFN